MKLRNLLFLTIFVDNNSKLIILGDSKCRGKECIAWMNIVFLSILKNDPKHKITLRIKNNIVAEIKHLG